MLDDSEAPTVISGYSYTNRTFTQHTPFSANTKHCGSDSVFIVPTSKCRGKYDWCNFLTASSYHQLDTLASLGWIPALRQWAPIFHIIWRLSHCGARTSTAPTRWNQPTVIIAHMIYYCQLGPNEQSINAVEELNKSGGSDAFANLSVFC